MFALSSVDCPIITQGRSAMFDPVSEHVTQGVEQSLRFGPRHPSPRRIDHGQPCSFIGIDVAHAGYWTLAEELRLDSAVAGTQRSVQHSASERPVEGLRT